MGGGSFFTGLIVACAVLLLAIIVLAVLFVRLQKKLARFMSGKDGTSLEATLEWLTRRVAEIDERLDEHQKGLIHIDTRVKRSVRGYSLIRYDAYSSGGAQSFSSALIDEHGDGYILSVVSNRTHTGVYAKQLTAGTADASLTTEETEALSQAKRQIA